MMPSKLISLSTLSPVVIASDRRSRGNPGRDLASRARGSLHGLLRRFAPRNDEDGRELLLVIARSEATWRSMAHPLCDKFIHGLPRDLSVARNDGRRDHHSPNSRFAT